MAPRFVDADYIAAKIRSHNAINSEVHAKMVEEAPEVELTQVVHGRLEIIEDDILCDTWIKCSVCGNEHETAYEQDLSSYSYCPNCGAKMDLEVSDG